MAHDLAVGQCQDAVGVGPGVAAAAGARVEQEHPAPGLGQRDVSVAKQRHLCPTGGGGVRQRIQIVFYAVHVPVRIENDDLIESGQPVVGLQRTKITVSGHGIGPQARVFGQCKF